MAYLNSENVAVFPIAKERPAGFEETRLITEHNLSGIIRQLLSLKNPGFIISTDIDSQGNCNVKFNLYGYSFDIDIPNDWVDKNLSGATSIYASIKIKKDIGEIFNQDHEGKYKGLELTAEEPSLTATEIDNGLDLQFIKILNVNNKKLVPITGATFLDYAIGGIDGKYQ